MIRQGLLYKVSEIEAIPSDSKEADQWFICPLPKDVA